MPNSSEQEKAGARDTLPKRFGLFETQLAWQDFVLGDRFSIADCYLFVMLFWAKTKVELEVPPNLSSYYDRLTGRDSVSKALADEGLS